MMWYSMVMIGQESVVKDNISGRDAQSISWKDVGMSPPPLSLGESDSVVRCECLAHFLERDGDASFTSAQQKQVEYINSEMSMPQTLP